MKTTMTLDRWSWRTLLIIFACGIGNVVGVTTIINATFSNFLVPVSQSLGWPRAQFSFVLTILSFVGVVAYPVAGRLIDRYGSRPIALAGNLAFGAAVGALALMPSAPMVVYALFIVLGIAASLPSTVLLARVVSTWFLTHRGLALGLSGGVAFGVGGAVIPPITQAMIDAWGWRGAYLGLAAIVVGVGFPVFFFLLREAPVPLATSSPHQGGALDRTRAEAMRTPSFWILFGAVSLGAGSIAAIITHIVPIVGEAGGSIPTALAALGALYMLNAVWQIGLGLVLDRCKSPRVAALFVLPGACGVIMLCLSGDPKMIIASSMLVGLSCGTEYGLLPLSIPRYFGFKAYGEIYGSIFGAIMLMQGVMPFVFDLVYQVSGSYRPAMFGVSGALVLCTAIIAMLPRFDPASTTKAAAADAVLDALEIGPA